MYIESAREAEKAASIIGYHSTYIMEISGVTEVAELMYLAEITDVKDLTELGLRR
jgi:hypothetical protein